MPTETTVTETERVNAIAALRNARDSVEQALFEMERDPVIPARVLDWSNDAARWLRNTAAWVQPAQERYNRQGC